MARQEGKTRFEVWHRPGIIDARARALAADIADLGIRGVSRVAVADVYLLTGTPDAAARRLIARELLADPVTQACRTGHRPLPEGAHAVEVFPRPGVTDTVGATALKGIADLGVSGISAVATGRRYFIYGAIDQAALENIAARLLANAVIHAWRISRRPGAAGKSDGRQGPAGIRRPGIAGTRPSGAPVPR